MIAPLHLPGPARSAFLLDLDGTLLDIAPAPDRVVVPPDLPGNLRRLRALCGDALAVVSGRPIEQIDALLGDVPFAVAGAHGSEIRHTPEQPIERLNLPPVPPEWLTEAATLVRAHPGAMLEAKPHGLVLHYRSVPQAGAALQAGLARLVAERPAYVLMAAKMAWELRPAGADKGTAVHALMLARPFLGRLPIFVGDDVTDEDGMTASRALGGLGLRVPDVFGDAAGVRAWIASLAAGDGWA